MDEIERLLEATKERRLTAARSLAQSHQALADLSDQLQHQQRAYVATWGQAVAAGWTAKELRELRMTEPAEAWRPRKRVRRSTTPE